MESVYPVRYEAAVTHPQGSPGSGEGLAAAANLGWMRPPLVYLASIVLGLLLQSAWPVALLPDSVGVPVGVSVVLIGVGLFAFAVRTFRAADTPIPGSLPTTTIVVTGPYRFSRNPIYLGFSLLQLGISLWLGSLWLLITLAGVVALMSFVVIPREERYLESRFPSDYLAYKASVRRWL